MLWSHAYDWTAIEGGDGDKLVATAIGVNDVSRHNLQFGSSEPEWNFENEKLRLPVRHGNCNRRSRRRVGTWLGYSAGHAGGAAGAIDVVVQPAD